MCTNLVHVAVTTYLRLIKKQLVLLQAPPTILGTDMIVVVAVYM